MIVASDAARPAVRALLGSEMPDVIVLAAGEMPRDAATDEVAIEVPSITAE